MFEHQHPNRTMYIVIEKITSSNRKLLYVISSTNQVPCEAHPFSQETGYKSSIDIWFYASGIKVINHPESFTHDLKDVTLA